VIVDSPHPPFWFSDCIGLSELRRALHTGYSETLRILDADEAPVYRLHYGQRFRYFIGREHALTLIRRYGSESARKRRHAQSAARPKGVPLWTACPHCGRKGSQWRSGVNTAGNREVKCGHCKRFYTINKGKRPPLQSTCIHCKAETRQWRQQVTSAGNLTIRCGHCRRHYTVKGNPEQVEESAALPRIHVNRAGSSAGLDW
jgi:transposase-like protein